MADTKISALTAATSPADADLLVTVQDVATTPVTKKVTWTTAKAFLKTYFDTQYYAPGGTDVALADGGTGASLADPNADRILFWDDSAGQMTWLTVGSGLSISGTTLTATASGSGDVTKVGTPVDNQMAVWTGDGTLEGTSDFTYNGTSLNLVTGKNFQIAGVTILADSAGTTTLSNIDALDATTEATIEAAIDTLANLTSIQGRTVTLADAGANAFFGWDDTAGAYENLTQAEARTILGLGTAAYVATDLADLNEATIEAAIDTLANLTSIQGKTVTLGGDFITSGASSLTLTTSGATNVTLPTTGTLATLAGSEILTNKTIDLTSNTLTGSVAEFNAALESADFYTTGGTDVALADGGTGASLTDPNADRIMFWDDSLGAITWLELGTNLSISGTTLNASGGGGSGLSYSEVTGTSQSMAVDTIYGANNASLVTFTLPDTAAVGKVVAVRGIGAGGWKIAQNASEKIHFNSAVTTTGTGGYLESLNRYDSVDLVCIVADTEWEVVAHSGSLIIV